MAFVHGTHDFQIECDGCPDLFWGSHKPLVPNCKPFELYLADGVIDQRIQIPHRSPGQRRLRKTPVFVRDWRTFERCPRLDGISAASNLCLVEPATGDARIWVRIRGKAYTRPILAMTAHAVG